jgi:hypothetical protein
MTANRQEGHWLFFVRSEDRPGAATSLAAAFSGRGIQIESFIGYGSAGHEEESPEGVIAITFHAFERRMDLVRRVLLRHEMVKSVRVFDYENDPRLVKSATAHVIGKEAGIRTLLEGIPVTLNFVPCPEEKQGLLIFGRPTDVDRALEALTSEKRLLSAAYAILAV